MIRLSWVALQDMVHIFIQLDKAVVHVSRLVIKPKGFEAMVSNKLYDPMYVIICNYNESDFTQTPGLAFKSTGLMI